MPESDKPAIGSIAWRDPTVPDAEGVRDFYSAVVEARPLAGGRFGVIRDPVRSRLRPVSRSTWVIAVTAGSLAVHRPRHAVPQENMRLSPMSWHPFRLFTMTVVCVFMSLAGQVLADQSRTWTSADGQFTVEAELVEVDEQMVRLRRTDGQVISVPLAKISDSDREYLGLRGRTGPQNDMKHVWMSQRPARLVELTAQLRTTNSSTTAVSKYVFRVTAPPNALEHQRAVLVSSDVPPAERKTHKNGASEFLEFHFPVAANAVVTNNVKFIVLLIPVDYFQSTRPPRGSSDSTRGDGRAVEEDHNAYLQPSKNVESDSPEIQRAAELIFRGQRNVIGRARAAYEFPSKALRFRVQSETLGAQKALQTGIGGLHRVCLTVCSPVSDASDSGAYCRCLQPEYEEPNVGTAAQPCHG